MKLHKSIFYASALLLGLSACEMKNEIWNNNGDDAAQGGLILDVTAQEPASLTRAAVSTADFPVDIKGKGDMAAVTRHYDTPSQIPSLVELPVGDYTVSAHSKGTLERRMTAPYYYGEKDVTITTTATTRTEVKCTMANSRITLRYSEEFLKAFDTWTATLDDGSNMVLTYDDSDLTPADVFWQFLAGTKQISVSVRAHSITSGDVVFASATYTKRSCVEGYTDIENEDFTGGDAIVINLDPATSATGDITGISIVTNVTFDNYDESVTIEVEDVDDDDPNGNDPVPGGEIEITKSYPDEGVVANYGQTSDFPNVTLDFTFPTGLKNLYVKVSGSEDFEVACSVMHLIDGDGLDLTSSDASELGGLFTLPRVGDKTYTFSLNDGLWDMLCGGSGFGGYPGKQVFTLKAVDKNGAVKSGELIITINE